MVRPTVFVCHGSTCRHHKGYDDLRAAIGAVADVADVRCQRVCDGPLAGAAIEGSLEWFKSVDSEKARRQLVDLVAGSGRLRHSLKKRRVKKRAGRLR
jgi:hypothetical protein